MLKTISEWLETQKALGKMAEGWEVKSSRLYIKKNGSATEHVVFEFKDVSV